MYRDSFDFLVVSVSLYGVWVVELVVYLREVVVGKVKMLYFYNVVYDGFIFCVLFIF